MSLKVVVTGASGFIGKVIVKDLLDHGHQVRGSVRSDTKAEHVRAAVGPDRLDRLEFVHLDLMSDDGWEETLNGADALLHTASPFPMGSPKDPEELIGPAVNGTLRALRAAHAAGVERVVVTSSCVAIYNDTLRADQTILDETNWSPTRVPETSAYDDSKTLAERAAWDFVNNDAPGMKLSTVNPGVVFGEPLDQHYGTSLALVERLLDGKDPALPKLSFPVVDVADVAAIHRLSLENPEAAGQRFAACAGDMAFYQMAETLNTNFSTSKAPTRVAPDIVVKLMAMVKTEMKTIVPRLGRSGAVSGHKARDMFGIEYIPPEEALLRSARYVTR